MAKFIAMVPVVIEADDEDDAADALQELLGVDPDDCSDRSNFLESIEITIGDYEIKEMQS